MAEAHADGEVAVRDPDVLLEEIERTRMNLARTIDALTERVSPGNVARHTLARVREQVARPEIQVVGGAAVLATVTVIAFAVWRRRR